MFGIRIELCDVRYSSLAVAVRHQIPEKIYFDTISEESLEDTKYLTEKERARSQEHEKFERYFNDYGMERRPRFKY